MKVYAGRAPVTGRKLHLTETIPVGPRQQKLVEQARTRFLNEVDEKRNPKTRATVDQLMEKYLAVLDVDATTKRGYRSKYNTAAGYDEADQALFRCRVHAAGSAPATG